MDPADTFLGRLLMDEITPVVMVLSTPLAEEACRKSGLDVVRLFAPFCVFNNIDVPVRTATDQPYRLQTFRLRMVYASEIRPWDPEVANKHLEDVVNKASENIRNDFQNDLPALQKMLTMAESEVVPSWLYNFNRDFSRALSFSDHEAFDHPVACLLVVSSEDEVPMNRFVDLFNTNQLPVHLSDNAMDPKIPKHYLLLHDGHVGTTEKALSVLSEMRGTFGLNDCRLLCINSLKGVAEEWRENPWVDYKNSSSSEDNACFLSIDDFNEIKTFMHDLSSKKIIPHLETKIRTLNQQVSATRKGFRNQIRNLWWRKGKEDAPETPDGPMYTFSSIESQIRILGDYAFMLRDYELALSNYRLLSTDYKLDKAWKRYAGVQEMVGLSLFMLDQSRKDSEYSMENAFNVYLRLGSLGLRNAARCGLWWAEMLKARGQYKEAAIVYFRMASEETSLHAAVFLEQAAYCYLFSSPPMLRKFGFHLVLAGNRYYNADQRRHAIRTYRCALSVYRKNDWSYISDHVHYNIGRWYAYLGMFDAAILHMLEVLECTHQSLTTQDLFLKDFLHIVQNTGRQLEVPKLQLPSINMSSIRVIFEDYRTYASPAAAVRVKESTWQALEENLIPSPVTNKSNWLDNRKIHLPKKYDSSVSVVGEAIKVQLELKNPLQVSISVANLSLVCEYRSSHAAEESDDSLSMDGIQNNIADPNISTLSDTNDHNSSFELSEINFLLGGGQTRDVQLSVIPKMEGFLRILGVKWTLSGSVMGYQSFDLDVKRKSRKGRGSVQPFRNMAFIVIKGLPKLKGFINHLPQKAYKGDLRLLMLELKNESEYSVKNLKMKFGQPRFLIPGSSEDINTEFPGCLQKQSSSLRKYASEDGLDKSGSLLFVFPSDSRISAGTTFRWPLWLHAALSGELSLCMSIYYEVDNLTCDMNYRTLRIHHELEVSPSIDVSISITPCPNRLQEFLVQMEVASKTNSESFWLQQLSSVGFGWKILPLSLTDSVCSSQLLLAGQKLLCFFNLKGSGKNSLGEDEQNCEQSDLRLGPHDDNDLLFDISRTPLADFHKQEKFQHGKTLQENPGMADFVLFSRLVEDVAGPDEAECIRLLSHHVCHRSITSKSPIQWLIIGPQTVIHDFSVPFFEVDFCCRIQNCSDAVASVKIITFDTFATAFGHSKDSPPLSDSFTSGWHEISFDTKPTLSDVSVSRHVRPSPESVTPFVWCASSSTKVELQPVSVAEVPLRICVFSPGIYDLSNYEMHYSLQFSDAEGLVKDLGWQSSGMNRGHPYYLSVLKSMP